MYLFSRTARLSQGGRLTDKIASAAELTEKVKDVTGLEVGLYAQQFSRGLGTIVWSTFVPDLAALEASDDALAASDEFQDMLEDTSDVFADGMDDALLQVVHGVPDPERPVNYVVAVRSVCAPGNMARGIELGVEIAEKAGAISGQPTLFCTGMTGEFGSVAWLTGYPDIQSLERGEQVTYADPAMIDLVDHDAATAYSNDPNVSGTTIYRRLV